MSRSVSGIRREDFGTFDVGGVRAVFAIDDRLLAGLRQHHELMRRGATDQPGVGFHRTEGKAAAREDAVVRVVHFLIIQSGSGFIPVEAVRIFHDEFAAAHQSKAWTDLVAEFGLDLIEIQRHLPVGANFPAEEIGDHFLVCRPEAEIALVPVLEPEQLLAIEVPASGFSPQLRRRGDGHEQFLRSRPIHLFANDAFDFTEHSQAQREIGVDSGRDLPDQAGAQHEAMADRFSLAWIFSQCGDKGFGNAHVGLWGNQPLNIIPERKNHDADQENQAHLLCQFSLPIFKWFSTNGLNKKEQQVPAVQNGDG